MPDNLVPLAPEGTPASSDSPALAAEKTVYISYYDQIQETKVRAFMAACVSDA